MEVAPQRSPPEHCTVARPILVPALILLLLLLFLLLLFLSLVRDARRSHAHLLPLLLFTFPFLNLLLRLL